MANGEWDLGPASGATETLCVRRGTPMKRSHALAENAEHGAAELLRSGPSIGLRPWEPEREHERYRQALIRQECLHGHRAPALAESGDLLRPHTIEFPAVARRRRCPGEGHSGQPMSHDLRHGHSDLDSLRIQRQRLASRHLVISSTHYFTASSRMPDLGVKPSPGASGSLTQPLTGAGTPSNRASPIFQPPRWNSMRPPFGTPACKCMLRCGKLPPISSWMLKASASPAACKPPVNPPMSRTLGCAMSIASFKKYSRR